MRRLIVATLAFFAAASAHALGFTLYTNQALWQANTGPSTLQDFSGYATSTSVMNAEVLAHVTVGTNLGALEVHGAEHDIFATGNGSGSRASGNAYYELNFDNAYRSAAFDIASFESASPPFDIASGAVDAGQVEILFANGFLLTYDIFGNDGSNIFFGVTADTAITRMRWIEAHERLGGNEESTLDNLRVGLAVAVPAPPTLPLAAGALVLMAALVRRRR